MKKNFPYLFLFCLYFLIGWSSFLLGQKITSDNRPIEQHFVSVDLPGRLGNNMFLYATGLAYALEHDKELVVTSDTSLLHNAFDIDINDRYDKNFPIWENLEKKNISHTGSAFREGKTFIPLGNSNYILLDGYFQNEKYFKKYRKEILKAFNFNKPTDEANNNLIKKIKKTNSVSLHIRRGDYLNEKNIQSVLSLYYYKNAVDYIDEHVKNPHFFIFSDDIEWAKENLKLTQPHTFVDINKSVNDYIDMYLMSLCDHNIIANSTFSWWGAWLNQNEDKIVIAPDKWLKNDDQFTQNIVPKEWVVFPTTADVAILYIATGRYIVFFDEFYKSMEKNFLPLHNKTYFVWTDSDRNFPTNVVKIPTENLGWPYATLYRFKLFQNEWDKLQHFDYMYYLNANISVVKPVSDEILPTQRQGIMATLHPGYYNQPWKKPYDKNPKSLAYIPDIVTPPHTQNNTYKSERYFMGGFQGGTRQAYKKLIDTLAKNIEIDEQNNVMAKWHDESHLNRYLYDKNPLVMTPAYGFPENGAYMNNQLNQFIDSHKILILDKSSSKWGGHKYLRGLTDTPKK